MSGRVAMLLAATLACACVPVEVPLDGGDGSVLDGGRDAARAARRTDAGRAYGPCHLASDCGRGEACDLQYPRGMCRPACTTSSECPENGSCEAGNCMPRCVPGADDCRDDQYCLVDAPGLCFPSCSSRADATAQRCQDVFVCAAFGCDPAIAFGAPIGAPCTASGQCHTGLCWTPETGWPGGMCVQTMRLPAHDAWLAAGPMPSAGCEDAYAVLGYPNGLEGDEGQCVPRCTTNDDCRDGYRCDRYGTYDAPLHTDGACLPWLCDDSSQCSLDRTCARIVPGGVPVCFRTPP